MPNRWVDHVKSFAAKNNLSYGCALSKPECKESYRAKYGVSKKLTKKQNIEMMGAEDFDAPNMKLVVKEKKKRRPKELVIEEEPEETIIPVKPKIKFNRINIGTRQYYIDPRNNALYDSAENVKKRISVGIWNAETETIE
tara:strand:- start:1189 stop:1608 length:420 start_codon:yes stop_codon:yes gene_type:complete